MLHEIVIAGFGGQGVMLMGRLLTYSGMLEDKEVTWMPSYGPEMRGGTANCTVVISTDPVASPVASLLSEVIAMNRPSLDKFEQKIKPNGLLIINTSLIDRKAVREDIKVLNLPANDLALAAGSDKAANMVALGAFVEITKVVSLDGVIEALKKVLPQRRHGLLAVNEKALREGSEFVKKNYQE